MSAKTALAAVGAELLSATLSVSELRLWTFLARSSTNWLNLVKLAMGSPGLKKKRPAFDEARAGWGWRCRVGKGAHLRAVPTSGRAANTDRGVSVLVGTPRKSAAL